MKILATQPCSLIEWKNHLSYVIFIAGCNFKCDFCYVPHLILPEKYENIKEISQDKILEEIKERASFGFIDAVSVSGGEPTTHLELADFLKKIKNLGLKVRLETNGSNPQMLKQLIQNKLVDSVALDIKNSKEKYSVTTGTETNLENIEKTLDIIKEIDYEVRTTLVPELHNIEDVTNIVTWLKEKGIQNLVLQQFRSDLPNQQTINPEFMKKNNFPLNEMENMKKEIDFNIEIRGD